MGRTVAKNVTIRAYFTYIYTTHKALIYTILFTGLISLALYGWYVYQNATLTRQAYTRLTDTIQDKKERIQDYIDTTRDRAQTFLADDAVKQAITTSLDQGKDVQELRQQLQNFQSYLQANRIHLVYADQRIAFTLPEQNSTIFQDGEIPATTELSASIERSRISLSQDISRYAIETEDVRPFLYITTPIMYHNSLSGFLVLEVNTDPINRIIQEHTNLGETGETMVGASMNGGAILLFPTRHDKYSAFNRYVFFGKSRMHSLQQAVQLNKGKGYDVDYRSVKTLASWTFIPHVDWGIIVKIDSSEIYGYLSLVLYLSFFLLCISAVATFLLLVREGVLTRYTKQLHPRYVALALAAINLIIVTALGISLYTYKQHRIQQEETYMHQKARDIAYFLDKSISITATAARSVAYDIEHNRLSHSDITTRLRQMLDENEQITGAAVAFAPEAYDEEKLFAPMAYRVQGKYHVHEFPVDYRKPAPPGESPTKWYRTGKEKKYQWLSPYDDPHMQQRVIPFTVSFYHPETEAFQGVVVVWHTYEKVSDMIEEMKIGPHDYSFLIDQNGSYIYHPEGWYTEDTTTIFDIARRRQSPQLRKIAENALQGEHGISSYFDQDNNTHLWLAYAYIPTTQWTIFTTFPESKVRLPSMYVYRMMLIIALFATCAGIGIILCCGNFTRDSYLISPTTAVALSIFLAVMLGIIWTYRGYAVLTRETDTEMIAVKDVSELTTFLDRYRRKMHARGESVPEMIPTGIRVNTISLEDDNFARISGLVWHQLSERAYQMYGQNPVIFFPHGKNTDISYVRTQQEDTTTRTTVWKFATTLPISSNFSHFPFDKYAMDIPLRARKVSDAYVMCIPYFDSYVNYRNTRKAISQKFDVPGILVYESYFAFSSQRRDYELYQNLYQGHIHYYQLQLYLTLSRRLMNSFVIFFLPLIILLATVYIYFLMILGKAQRAGPDETVNTTRSIGTYAAIFFSLVTLHQMLRTRYPAGELLYIEYIFLFTYLNIFVSLLYSLIIYITPEWSQVTLSFANALSRIYWPLNLCVWVITTIWIFYE